MRGMLSLGNPTQILPEMRKKAGRDQKILPQMRHSAPIRREMMNMPARMAENRTLRMATLKKFGFGPEIMKESKVCSSCGCTCTAEDSFCKNCGAELPRETLYDFYKCRHLYCSSCDTVVRKTATFCPECGKRLQPGRFRRLQLFRSLRDTMRGAL